MPKILPLMLFAAGFGTRMGALTAEKPKPLLKVAGKTLLDHAIDIGRQAGVSRMVANAHYRADQIINHLAGSDIAVSVEAGQILETGGGLRHALPLLGDGPVAILNTDAVWTGRNPLTQLFEIWDPTRMDALLLTLPAETARSATGRSDFTRDAENRIAWAQGRPGVLYLGAQIINPRILGNETGPVFSMHGPWTRAIDAGRAFCMTHQGDWCDVGHPEGIAEAEEMLKAAHVRA